MRLSLLSAAVLLLSAAGCVKDVSSEDRLDRETQSAPLKEGMDADQIAKVNCSDAQDGLASARNEQKPESDRVLTYIELYDSLKKRTSQIEEAMARNPDLQYREGSQELVASKETCVNTTAEVRLEFERYVRELVDVPTVQEIKGGNTVVVARMDFGTLRQAIEALAPDDKENLLGKVASAEKKVAPKVEEKSGKKR